MMVVAFSATLEAGLLTHVVQQGRTIDTNCSVIPVVFHTLDSDSPMHENCGPRR